MAAVDPAQGMVDRIFAAVDALLSTIGKKRFFSGMGSLQCA
ncbi:MAG: hypothetical protein ACXU84_03145 [Xanthobacteraceae bacterium]